jgi:hypothetical protein
MKLYIPPQLKRLALAFAVFISLFLLIRHYLVPDTFGQFGFYRGASLADNEAVPLHYAGKAACIDCHQEIEDAKKEDAHKGIACETCHGPGLKHIETTEAGDIVKPSDREFCGLCHKLNAARKSDVVAQVDLKKHNIDKKCIECHNPHQPWKMKE